MTRMGVWMALAALAAPGAGAQTGEPRAVQEALEAATVRAEAARVRALRQVERQLARTRGTLAPARVELARSRAALREVEAAMAARRVVAPPAPRAVGYARGGAPALEIPAPWLSQDPADSLYRQARARLNDRRYGDAARLFAEIREAYPRSGYAGDSPYFEALARSRMASRSELAAALELLELQRTRYPDAATGEDARALRVRIEGQLARRGDARAAEAVVGVARGVGSTQAACDDEEQAVRATALSALLQMDPERARPILMEVLRSRDECSAELRAQAVFILAQGGDEADPETVALLVDLAHRNPDPNPEVREAAVFWLSQSGGDAAVDALLEILRSDSVTPGMAEQALFALGQSGHPRAVQALRDYAGDTTADPELRANAIFWLAQEGGSEAGPFLRSLYGSLEDPELKERVLFAVAEASGPENLAWLTRLALDPQEDVEVRKAALFWAGEAGMGPDQALEIYRTAPDRELREQAIFVLTQVAEDGEAVDALMEIARSEEDPQLRQQAIFWLGESDDPRVAEFLLQILRGGGGGDR